jgi:hypothetical protein
MTKKIVRKPSVLAHVFLMTLYLIPAMVLMAGGIFLCVTIVGIAPGMVLIGLAGVPLAAESRRYIKRKVAWELHEEGPEKFRTGRGKGGRALVKLHPNIEYEYDPETDDMVPVKKPWVTEN